MLGAVDGQCRELAVDGLVLGAVDGLWGPIGGAGLVKGSLLEGGWFPSRGPMGE